MSLNRFLSKLNISRVICDHVKGKNHTLFHRRVVGIGIMLLGVSISTIAHHHCEMTGFFGDLFGYALHGFGLIPFIESEE